MTSYHHQCYVCFCTVFIEDRGGEMIHHADAICADCEARRREEEDDDDWDDWDDDD